MKRTNRIFALSLAALLAGAVLGGCEKKEQTPLYPPSAGTNYTIPQLDLSVKPQGIDGKYDYLYQYAVLDNSRDYVAHPDSVLLKNGNILTVYPEGHGKGSILSKISSDGGKSWGAGIANTPASWKDSQETPTIYRLHFKNGSEKLILISANPQWDKPRNTKGGFNCSVSSDEGAHWSEFQLFHNKGTEHAVKDTIVAMASLTQLKENGTFVDKWMGFFHDREFNNYKSILTFDESGNPQWSAPEKYFEPYSDVEKGTNMCEVEVVRSDGGKGDQLCLLTRSNSKRNNSMVSFSNDEGVTWSQPKELPAALNGERLKADYTSDGRLFITFRSIERDLEKGKRNNPEPDAHPNWYSEGWIAWVGAYDDLVNGTEGQYRIKIAHTYLDKQTAPAIGANADTGYCGTVLLPDGTIVTSSYGQFDYKDTYTYQEKKKEKTARKTSIVSKRIRLEDTDALVKQLFLS